MKSKYFKNLAKGLVIISAALALVNCDDTTAANSDAVQQEVAGQQDVNDPSNPADPSQQTTDPTNPANPADPSQTVTDPAQQGTDPATNPADPSQTVTDPTDPNAGQIVDPTANPSQGGNGDPAQQGTDPSTNPVDTTVTNPPVASSGSVGADPAPASSETVKPASSSSEPVVESSSSEEVKPAGIFLAEGKEEEKDQMQIVYTEDIEPCIWDNDKKRNLCKILAYPKQLSETQKHAVVVWGPGGGSDPKEYRSIISRLASHGFVVVAIPQSPGNANEGIEALNWLDKKNKDPNDPLYNKLDMNTVGASGHSMGGLESEQMVIKDKRVLTAFLNNSGDWNGAGANKVATDRSIAILFGEVGMEKDNAKNDYNNAGVKAPACLIEMTGGPRNSEGGYGHGSGSWDGMAATVAWMRWHLGGEDFRKADFVGSTGKYIDGSIIGKQGHWKTQCKNF